MKLLIMHSSSASRH